MKKTSLVCSLTFLLFTGCTHHYVISLNNGTQIGAKTRPHLEGGSYHFKDALGRDATVPAGRVAAIEPAGDAAKRQKSGFIDSPGK